MDGKKSVPTPGVANENANDENEDHESLNSGDTTAYRACNARANVLSQDRFDIKYAAKTLSRVMSSPRKRDWRKLIRLAKYPNTKVRFIVPFKYQEKVSKIDIWTGTDYAGCMRARKPTSGWGSKYGAACDQNLEFNTEDYCFASRRSIIWKSKGNING